MGVAGVTQGLTMTPIFCRSIRRLDEFFRVSVRASSSSVQSPVSPHPWRILDNILPWYMSLLLLFLVLFMFAMLHLFAVEWLKCHIRSHCDPTVISSQTTCKWSCINSSPDLFWFFCKFVCCQTIWVWEWKKLNSPLPSPLPRRKQKILCS